MDAAAAGEPYADGSLNWWGIGGTWFWIDPAKDFAFIGMIQQQGRSLLERHADPRLLAQSRLPGARRLRRPMTTAWQRRAARR